MIFAGMLLIGFIVLDKINSPKFKVGDCVTSKYAESWDKDEPIYKIKTVGKYKYLYENCSILMGNHDFCEANQELIEKFDEKNRKVECPKDENTMFEK